MVSKDDLLEVLPVREETILAKEDRQTTDDIQAEILSAHEDFAADYDLIYHFFNTGNIVESSREIFDFLKRYVPYTKESGRYQTVKNPRAILLYNEGSMQYDRVDCKNYACFIGGIISAIARHDPGDWSWCYRFASYEPDTPEPGHVFVVVKIGEKELWIDPVFTHFNGGDMHEWEIDKVPAIGGLYRVIAGPPDEQLTGAVTVSTQDAANNWLVAVQEDLFGLPELLMSNPQITNSKALKQTLINCGVNLNALQAIFKYLKKTL